MPPPSSPERPLKRSRNLSDEHNAGAGDGNGGVGGSGENLARNRMEGAAAAAVVQIPPATHQPQKQQQQQQQSCTPLTEQQQQRQPPGKSPQQLPRALPQPQTQLLQQQLQQPQHAPAAVPLASGAVTVLPTAAPQWAEEALQWVDPFWQPKETLAVITTREAGPAPGTHGQLQSASALFTVSPSALAAIADKKAQARLMCVQPGDGPPRRCHWYGGSYALLNGRQYGVTKEDRVQLMLGPNQADQASDVSSGLVRGANRLTLLWPVGVAGAVAALRLCEPRSPEDLSRRLAPPLPLRHAVELVRAYVAGGTLEADGGGGAEAAAVAADPGQDQSPGAAAPEAGSAEADNGTEGGAAALDSGPMTVSLRCPLHGGLAAAPAHFGSTAAAAPLAFFDLGSFLELAKGSGSWSCPASGRLGNLADLRPHAFLSAVLRTLEHNRVRHCVEAIEVAPCGRWRPKDSRVPLMSALGSDDEAGSGDEAGTDPAARPPPTFDPRLLDPEDDGGAVGRDVVDLTDD